MPGRGVPGFVCVVAWRGAGAWGGGRAGRGEQYRVANAGIAAIWGKYTGMQGDWCAVWKRGEEPVLSGVDCIRRARSVHFMSEARQVSKE